MLCYMQLPEPKNTELSWVFNLKLKIMNDLYDLERLRLGKVLTIIDAVIIDKDQQKAVKDLVRNSFYEKEIRTTCIQCYLIQDIEKNVGKIKMSEREREIWNELLKNIPYSGDTGDSQPLV